MFQTTNQYIYVYFLDDDERIVKSVFFLDMSHSELIGIVDDRRMMDNEESTLERVSLCFTNQYREARHIGLINHIIMIYVIPFRSRFSTLNNCKPM